MQCCPTTTGGECLVITQEQRQDRIMKAEYTSHVTNQVRVCLRREREKPYRKGWCHVAVSLSAATTHTCVVMPTSLLLPLLPEKETMGENSSYVVAHTHRLSCTRTHNSLGAAHATTCPAHHHILMPHNQVSHPHCPSLSPIFQPQMNSSPTTTPRHCLPVCLLKVTRHVECHAWRDGMNVTHVSCLPFSSFLKVKRMTNTTNEELACQHACSPACLLPSFLPSARVMPCRLPVLPSFLFLFFHMFA